VIDERIDWHWRVDGSARRAQARELFTAELVLDADNADLTDDEPVKLSGGWLIDDGDRCGPQRIRMRDITSYAHVETVGGPGVTCVWIRGRNFPHELQGDRLEKLDAYFAEHPDT
jgi:hypothetical protein